MERHLSLIKTDFKEMEKRVFPRFPFGFMIFKEENQKKTGAKKVFEVRDISLSGMQVSFKDGGHDYSLGEKIEGQLQWRGAGLEIKGLVQWIREGSIGIIFNKDLNQNEKIKNFLSFDNIVAHIKPLHKNEMAEELPNNLKYWLKADGVLEIFIWQHPTSSTSSFSGISHFQILMMEHFIEWEEGVGIRTGKMITQRDLETPLSHEDEYTFQIDDVVSELKVELALGVVEKMSSGHLPNEAKEFLITKMGR